MVSRFSVCCIREKIFCQMEEIVFRKQATAIPPARSMLSTLMPAVMYILFRVIIFIAFTAGKGNLKKRFRPERQNAMIAGIESPIVPVPSLLHEKNRLANADR